MEWYLGDLLLVSYSPDSKETHSENLCDSASNNDILVDFCKSGGSLSIQSVRIKKGNFNISSLLVTTGTYISLNLYEVVECGDDITKEEVPTNFTMTCNPVTLNVTNNDTNVDGGICEGVMEFICKGSNLDSFQWTYNDVPLTANFNYSNFSFAYQSNLPGISCNNTFANADNCFADRFNFKSVCVADLSYLKTMNVSSIGCSSNGTHRRNNITCKYVFGERAKRARHSQVCSIENHDIYIIVRTYVTFAL